MQAQAAPPEPTWDEMMEDTERAVKALSGIYDRCLRVAGAIKNKGGSLEELELLLNQTAPVTDEDRRLAFVVCFLARVKRGSLIEYLFKIRRACLLLLVDGRAAATALGLENDLDIRMDDSGVFRVARLGAAGSRARAAEARAAPGGESRPPAASSASSEGEARPRSRRRGGRRARGRKDRDEQAPRPEPADPTRARARPVMNMTQCFDLLANLDGPPGSPRATPEGAGRREPSLGAEPAAPSAGAPDLAARARESPYLAAVVLGSATRAARAEDAAPPGARAGEPKPPASEAEPERAAAAKPERAAEAKPERAAEAEPERATEAEGAAEAKREEAGAAKSEEAGAAKSEEAGAAKETAAPALSVSWADDDYDDFAFCTLVLPPAPARQEPARAAPPPRAAAGPARSAPPRTLARAPPSREAQPRAPPSRAAQSRAPAPAQAHGKRRGPGGGR